LLGELELLSKGQSLGLALTSKAPLLELSLEGIEDKGDVEDDLLLLGVALGERLGVEQGRDLHVVLSQLQGSGDRPLRVGLVELLIVDNVAIPLMVEGKQSTTIAEAGLKIGNLDIRVINELFLHPLEESILE